jgi:hypothetical protein
MLRSRKYSSRRSRSEEIGDANDVAKYRSLPLGIELRSLLPFHAAPFVKVFVLQPQSPSTQILFQPPRRKAIRNLRTTRIFATLDWLQIEMAYARFKIPEKSSIRIF